MQHFRLRANGVAPTPSVHGEVLMNRVLKISSRDPPLGHADPAILCQYDLVACCTTYGRATARPFANSRVIKPEPHPEETRSAMPFAV